MLLTNQLKTNQRMNNIFHINLGGIPLTIDEDAYKILKDYLLDLHNHFKDSEEKEEITDGIEQRLGELLSENQDNGAIVSISMVENAIELMGRPSEFLDEEPDDSAEKTEDKSFDWSSLKFGRRLFRDQDDNVLGGVCSGLSAYLGIKEPVFMRIIFLILIFGFGVSIFFYLLLWIIIPEAKSNSDRLKMRGEPVNVDNLSKIITEQANRLGKKFQNLGEDLSEKMGGKGSSNKGFASKEFNIDNEFIRTIIDGISKVFQFIKKAIGSIGLFYFALLWVLLFIGLNKGHIALDLLPSATATSNLYTMITLALIIGLPIFFFGYKFSQLIFKSKLNSTVSGVLVGTWIASIIGFSFIVSKNVSEYAESSTITETIVLDANHETIQFTGLVKPFINQPELKQISIDFKESNIDDFVGFETNIQFKESKDDSFYCLINKTARAKNKKLASQRAESIDLSLEQKNDEVIIPLNLQLAVNDKFVAQSGGITIFIPKGIQVSFDDRVMQSMPYFADMESCKVFQLTDDGFNCAKNNPINSSEEVIEETTL